MKTTIWIFEYDDYRKFIKDFYSLNKSLDSKYSYRYLAKAAGYKSPSAFLEVISGKKNLSDEGALKFARALKLNKMELQFFKTLVFFNQATNLEDRSRFAKDISKLRLNKKIVSLSETQYKLFEQWYYTSIIEMVSLPGFKEDPEWIADHVIPPIQTRQASIALEELIKMGLLARNEEGSLVQKESNVSTPSEVSSAYVANWHREQMKKAAESIDRIPREMRDISGVYFSFSLENMKAIKDLVHRFREEILELSSRQATKDIVFQLNLQLFPVARVDPKGDV